jgi:predicted dehydrogenase
LDPARLATAAAKLGAPPVFAEAQAMIRGAKLDLFCFCTLPSLRRDMIRLGIESGARLIAFEKPVALTSAEGLEVKNLLDAAGVKAVVSHQHRYGVHY